MTLACILGCSGPILTDQERRFFRKVQPWGFILFKRNIETPAQVIALTKALRETVARPDAPILIDQEGGRVQRLGPPHWPAYPSARAYGALAAADRRDMARLDAVKQRQAVKGEQGIHVGEASRSAACRVLTSSMVMVMGPTPPGTGVM